MVKNNNTNTKLATQKVDPKSKDIIKKPKNTSSPKKPTPAKKQVEEVKTNGHTSNGLGNGNHHLDGAAQHQPKEMWDYFALDAKYSK